MTDFKSEMKEVLEKLIKRDFGDEYENCNCSLRCEEIKKEVIDKSLSSLLALIEKRMIKEDKLMKLIPEVYADVFPLCNKVIGYTKDGTQYILQQERGEDLAKAILSEIKQRMGI